MPVLPGRLANVLAGVMSGTSWLDAVPAAGVDADRDDSCPRSHRRDAGEDEPVHRRHGHAAFERPGRARRAGGRPGRAGCAARRVPTADQPSSYLKVAAEEYSRLALAVDRLFIESARDAGARPLPARARRSSQRAVRLVRG